MEIVPFVQWVGGKRQLLWEIITLMPERFGNYFEPFVGGGALLFAMQPKGAVINDWNKPLILTYRCIREYPNQLIRFLHLLDKGQGGEFYYEVRDKFNEKLRKEQFDLSMAGLFLYLNHHCFNGVYRVNQEGMFNVGWGNRIRSSFDEENLRRAAEYLKSVRIYEGDFEQVSLKAKKGDFVFFDSPYDGSFTSYNKERFGIEDHVRLAKVFRELTERGCMCMLTNNNTELIRKLYEGFRMEIVGSRRSVNADGFGRRGEDIIIMNY